MHVAIDASPWDNARGFGRFTRSLVAALAARDTGFRYTLLFDQPPQRPVPENIKIVFAGAGQSMAEASAGKGIRKSGDMFSQAMAARRVECDVFFYPAVYSYFPLLSRTPSVVCYHDTIPERFPDLIFPAKLNFRLWQIKTWIAKRWSTRIMTVSQTSADDLADILQIPRQKIDVITEAADPIFREIKDKKVLNSARQQYGVKPGGKIMICVGGFNRHKKVIGLINAMSEILKNVPNVYLLIVGNTSGDRFWDNVEELQEGASRNLTVSEKVIFTGEIDDNELAVLLNVADALVFPSMWEGFGLPAVEAMACGTPVLSSDQGSSPEIVGDGGLFFDPKSSEDISRCVVEFFSDPSLQARLSGQAVTRAGTFDWDKAASMAEECFINASK